MEESKKKLVMIIVIVVCLGVAGAIFLGTGGSGGGGIDDISDEEMTWMKCRNQSCKAEFQTGLKEYYKFVKMSKCSMRGCFQERCGSERFS
jgi:hypothetical protein